jgi:hypothetical protein
VNLGNSRSQPQSFGVAVPGVALKGGAYMLHHAHHVTEQENEAR